MQALSFHEVVDGIQIVDRNNYHNQNQIGESTRNPVEQLKRK